jgi:hypothetical protein
LPAPLAEFMKKLFLILIILIAVLFLPVWTIVQKGYDKQNQVILLLKKIIPNNVARFIRDTVFFIPNSKSKKKITKLIEKKNSQGLNGELIYKKKVNSNKKDSFEIYEYFLPFKKLDTRAGWASTENSLRAHYLDTTKEDVFVISGEGETIYFKKDNIFKKQLNQKILPNNIKKILKENNFKLIGIRDMLIDEEKIYITLLFKSSEGYSMNIYKSDINKKNLNFSKFFETKDYMPEYNIHTGGRIVSFLDNKLLLSIGTPSSPKSSRKNAQNINSLQGKIISIDKTNKKFEIISKGHRNPQGLFYSKENNLIINAEHGPKGGDEINLNYYNSRKIANFGWPIASYGTEYNGEDPFKKSHKKHGFIEPLKYYVPSIGISELTYIKKNNMIIVSSLRAGSIYLLKAKDDLSNIVAEDRIYFQNQRIRDIKYDKRNNALIMLFEMLPSIGIIKLK